MYYRNEVQGYFKNNRILALKFDRALSSVRVGVSNQIEMIGSGAKRALYYSSCFTSEYQDVCKQQKQEDIRFTIGPGRVIEGDSVVFEMVKVYFDEIFKSKTTQQLEKIKKILMTVNIHIAASTLTQQGFSLGGASAVAVSTNVSFSMSALTGRAAGIAVGIAGVYGIVQKAAESANQLRSLHPWYYFALYSKGLEMMYFLVSSIFERAGAFRVHQISDDDIADIIKRMIR